MITDAVDASLSGVENFATPPTLSYETGHIMRNFLTIANFKSNKDASSIAHWLETVSGDPLVASQTIAVAPAFPYLHLLSSVKSISICAQDVSPFPQGSYTGAVNASQLKDLSVKYCLIGHSERRLYFKETDSDIANKSDSLLEYGIIPIILLDTPYIDSQISALSAESKSSAIFVYEPLSKIGGTQAAANQAIEENILKIMVSSSTKNPVLYGGSVNSDNLGDLLMTNIGGAVVGSASQEPSTFLSLIEAISRNG